MVHIISVQKIHVKNQHIHSVFFFPLHIVLTVEKYPILRSDKSIKHSLGYFIDHCAQRAFSTHPSRLYHFHNFLFFFIIENSGKSSSSKEFKPIFFVVNISLSQLINSAFFLNQMGFLSLVHLRTYFTYLLVENLKSLRIFVLLHLNRH